MSALYNMPVDRSVAIEVVSCTFLRYNCDHPVFQKEYTRSNRKAGTKILRCFPHCCPEHATRCYCGCSIHILVTFRNASIVNDSDIIVCARFEASSSSPDIQTNDEGDTATRKLALGEPVVLPPEMLQPMPQDSVESLWIRAYREGKSKQESVPEVRTVTTTSLSFVYVARIFTCISVIDNQNSILYVMNNYRFPKWYYNYESGATKSQREMKHYLRAYVLRLERPRDLSVENWGGSWIASVVARHASPGFTLISYRRASCRAIKASGDGDSETRGDSNTESDRDDSDPLNRRSLFLQSSLHAPAVQDSQLLNLRNDHDDAGGILFGLRYASQRESRNPFDNDDAMKPDPQSPSHHNIEMQSEPQPRLPRELDETVFWTRPKYAKTVVCARELSVIQYFITHAAVDELWSSIVRLEERLRESWIKSIYNAARDQRSLDLLLQFCVPTTSPRHQLRRDQESLFAVHPVLALCAEVAVEFATSSALQDLIGSTLQVDFSAESRKLKMRRQFALLIDGVHSHLNAFLAAKRVKSAADLVDELVTLVHQNQQFRWMQTSIRELLELTTPDRFAFEAFCAQSNETFMSSGTQPPRQRTSALASGDGLSLWNQRWLLNSRSLHTDDLRRDTSFSRLYHRATADNNAFQLTTWELLSTIQQFGAIDMELDSAASLRVRSVFCASQESGHPMHLTLDGKYRIFRTFPSGMSTMATTRDGWVYGDYFGHIESPSSIKLWFFVYHNRPIGNGQIPARCLAMHLTLIESGSSWEARYEGSDIELKQVMRVSIKVDDAMCPPVSDDVERDQDLLFLSSAARHSLWKSLHWTPSTEFQVEYQRIVVS